MIIPFVPRELVDSLDRVYPACHPDINDRKRSIWLKAGQRSVVEMLKEWLKAQDETLADAPKGRLPNVLVQPTLYPEGAGDGYPGPGSSTAARTQGSAGNRLGSDT